MDQILPRTNPLHTHTHTQGCLPLSLGLSELPALSDPWVSHVEGAEPSGIWAL